MKDSLVIIPTYNEKENVAEIVRAVLSQPSGFELLIVDDNSPDGTAEIVKSLMLEYPDRLHLEERAGKLGLGTAYIHGFVGLWLVIMNSFLKWMPIFHILQKI